MSQPPTDPTATALRASAEAIKAAVREHYFPHFGFMPIACSEVAPAVQVSAEFTGACPDSAAVLALTLG